MEKSDNRDDSMHIGVSITDELRRFIEDPLLGYAPQEQHIKILTEIADRIDAEHAQLERDYKVACEVNERQDEQYADMVHKLDRAYEKNRNQRRQLTEVQEALHRRNEGELKRRWMREEQDLELQIAKMRLESVELPKDADGEPIHIGDVMRDRSFPDAKYTVVGIGEDEFFTRDASGELYKHTASLYIHYKQPTVEDTLREFADEMNQNLGMYMSEAIDADEWRDADAKTVEKFAAKLRLAEVEDA